ncbi:MAG: hypothetical protein J3K34DRAFT_400789, partial [Monoraphidium minutum]
RRHAQCQAPCPTHQQTPWLRRSCSAPHLLRALLPLLLLPPLGLRLQRRAGRCRADAAPRGAVARARPGRAAGSQLLARGERDQRRRLGLGQQGARLDLRPRRRRRAALKRGLELREGAGAGDPRRAVLALVLRDAACAAAGVEVAGGLFELAHGHLDVGDGRAARLLRHV